MPPSESHVHSTQINEYTIGFEGTSIACMLDGVYLAITGANIYLLLQRKKRTILLSYTIVQLALTMLDTTMWLYTVPGQALAIFGITDSVSIDFPLGKLSVWPAILQTSAFVFNTCVSDAFLLYRCYHINNLHNKYVLAVPALLYIATVGSSLAWIIVNSFPKTSFSNHAVRLAGICYLSLSATMNICATYLITIRLWKYRRAICNAIGPHAGSFYLSYIAMTLESALLYSVFAITTLILFTLNSQLEHAFMSVLGLMQAISPALIIYRIARGFSFEVGGDGCMTVGSIHFASPPDELQAVAGPHSVHQDASDDLNVTQVPPPGNSTEEDQRYPA